MKTSLTILVSVIFSLFGAYILIAYVPLSFFPDVVKYTFGSTITTILGSDTISGSRTTINTNFANLNAGKEEISDLIATTSFPALLSAAALATIGTITTGQWNATAIPVNKGGTGTTTPSLYQVLLGNGANGITVASSTGTSGQVFTSNGAGMYPSWTSTTVDQSLAYTWTGLHTFNTGGFIDNASSTFNGANTITFMGTIAGGNYTGTVIKTATSTTFTATTSALTWVKPENVSWVEVEMMGGGGGGGGAKSTGTAASAGGGGGGAYCKATVQVSGNVTINVGAGGPGGSTAASDGSNGGDSTFAGVVTVTAGGGSGGGAGNNSLGAGGSGGSCTNADLNGVGQTGETGDTFTASSGLGAPTSYGMGGPRAVTDGVGTVGTGFGSGGSGARRNTTNQQVGGYGRAGFVRVTWVQ